MLTASSLPPLNLPIWMGVSMTLFSAATHSLDPLVRSTQPPWSRTCQALCLPAPNLETLATQKTGLCALRSPQCPSAQPPVPQCGRAVGGTYQSRTRGSGSCPCRTSHGCGSERGRSQCSHQASSRRWPWG